MKGGGKWGRGGGKWGERGREEGIEYPPCPPPQEIVSTLSFANYGMFIYTQRPVIDANTLRKNIYFLIFLFPFAQYDLLS